MKIRTGQYIVIGLMIAFAGFSIMGFEMGPAFVVAGAYTSSLLGMGLGRLLRS